MKKKFCVAAIAFALVCMLTGLVACTDASSTLKILDEALSQNYSKVTVNVNSVKDGVELNGTYNITFQEDGAVVEYTFDKLNELDPDGDNDDGYIGKVTGTATVRDGKLVEDNVDLDEIVVEYHGFSFRQMYLDNIKAGKSTFSADVTNPKGFVGNGLFVCTDMHVDAIFGNERLIELKLTYVSEQGFDVEVTYLFTPDVQ